MDHVLIDYLRSGECWVLVGSGPSIEAGYPSWKSLADTAVTTIALEAPGHDRSRADRALKSGDYPRVFSEAQSALGAPRLLQVLNSRMQRLSSSPSRMYELIAKW